MVFWNATAGVPINWMATAQVLGGWSEMKYSRDQADESSHLVDRAAASR
jgi:hypothetical protein